MKDFTPHFTVAAVGVNVSLSAIQKFLSNLTPIVSQLVLVVQFVIGVLTALHLYAQWRKDRKEQREKEKNESSKK